MNTMILRLGVMLLLGLSSLALAEDLETRLMFMLNDLRSRGMPCPGQAVGQPAPLLDYNPRLEQAALRQARDMGEVGFISHFYAGLGPRDRVAQAGYAFSRLSEIIFKGSRPDPLRALEWWLNSPVHCQAIMNPSYLEVGIAFWPNGNAWVVVLARPK